MSYYKVKAKLVIDIDTNKTKKFDYLVEAVSPTDAEATLTEFLKEQGEQEFEITDANETKFRDVVNNLSLKELRSDKKYVTKAEAIVKIL